MKKIINWLKQPSKIILFFMNKNFFWWLNDKLYLKIKYKLIMKSKLNIENPKTYNEKMQWLKLYDRKPEYTKMVDKYDAKEYVADIIGEEYIIPTLGIYDKFDDIDFDKLPDRFVLKCTHDSGAGLVICKDKSKLDWETVKKKVNKSLKINYYYASREWPYKNVNPRIIIEKLLETDELIDYKFFCFNGEPKYVWIGKGKAGTQERRLGFFDINLKKVPFKATIVSDMTDKEKDEIVKPKNYEIMIEKARELSKGHAFLRVDLYNIDGKIYFGELTFYTTAGFMKLEPVEYDKILGDMINLKEKNKNNKKEG